MTVVVTSRAGRRAWGQGTAAPGTLTRSHVGAGVAQRVRPGLRAGGGGCRACPVRERRSWGAAGGEGCRVGLPGHLLGSSPGDDHMIVVRRRAQRCPWSVPGLQPRNRPGRSLLPPEWLVWAVRADAGRRPGTVWAVRADAGRRRGRCGLCVRVPVGAGDGVGCACACGCRSACGTACGACPCPPRCGHHRAGTMRRLAPLRGGVSDGSPLLVCAGHRCQPRGSYPPGVVAYPATTPSKGIPACSDRPPRLTVSVCRLVPTIGGACCCWPSASSSCGCGGRAS